MDKLETDKTLLQLKLQQPTHPTVKISSVLHRTVDGVGQGWLVFQECADPSSSNESTNAARPTTCTNSSWETNFYRGDQLKREVEQLQRQLNDRQETQRHEIEEILCEEQNARNENVRLQRKLQVEVSD